jgi:hypothetical protein
VDVIYYSIPRRLLYGGGNYSRELAITYRSASPTATPELAQIGEHRSIQQLAFGCTTQDEIDKLNNFLIVEQDQAAFRNELSERLLTGECVQWNQGQPVYVEDVSVWHGDYQLRAEGETVSYWTQKKALESAR